MSEWPKQTESGNRLYKEFNRAFLGQVQGYRTPQVCELSASRKPELALLFAQGEFAVPEALGLVVYASVENRFDAIMRAPWLYFKGSVLVFREELGPNEILFWDNGKVTMVYI